MIKFNVCFTGPRPKKLFGYNSHADYQPIVDRLKHIIEELYKQGATCFISGGAQGIDQCAFWAVEIEKSKGLAVKNNVYIPHANQASRWAKTGLFSQEEYNRMLSHADNTKNIADVYHMDTNTYGALVHTLMKRNEAMVNDAYVVVGVYPHDSDFMTDNGGTAACLRYAKKQDRIIVLLDPHTHAIKILPDNHGGTVTIS